MIEAQRYITPEEERTIEGLADKQKLLMEHLKQEAHAQALGTHVEWATRKRTMLDDMENSAKLLGEHGQVAVMNQWRRQFKEMADQIDEQDKWREQYGTSYSQWKRGQNDYENRVQRAVAANIARGHKDGSGFVPLAMTFGVEGPNLLKVGNVEDWGKLPEQKVEPIAGADHVVDQETEEALAGEFDDPADLAGDNDVVPAGEPQSLKERVMAKIFGSPGASPAINDPRWNEQIREYEGRSALGKAIHSNPKEQRDKAIERHVDTKTIPEVKQMLMDRQRDWPKGLTQEAVDKMKPQEHRALVKVIDKRRMDIRGDREQLIVQQAKRETDRAESRRKGVLGKDALVSKNLAHQLQANDEQKWDRRVKRLGDVVGVVKKAVSIVPTIGGTVKDVHELLDWWNHRDEDAADKRSASKASGELKTAREQAAKRNLDIDQTMEDDYGLLSERRRIQLYADAKGISYDLAKQKLGLSDMKSRTEADAEKRTLSVEDLGSKVQTVKKIRDLTVNGTTADTEQHIRQIDRGNKEHDEDRPIDLANKRSRVEHDMVTREQEEQAKQFVLDHAEELYQLDKRLQEAVIAMRAAQTAHQERETALAGWKIVTDAISGTLKTIGGGLAAYAGAPGTMGGMPNLKHMLQSGHGLT
jgi:hypothetical protein